MLPHFVFPENVGGCLSPPLGPRHPNSAPLSGVSASRLVQVDKLYAGTQDLAGERGQGWIERHRLFQLNHMSRMGHRTVDRWRVVAGSHVELGQDSKKAVTAAFARTRVGIQHRVGWKALCIPCHEQRRLFRLTSQRSWGFHFS